jgi:hypothetical protein
MKKIMIVVVGVLMAGQASATDRCLGSNGSTRCFPRVRLSFKCVRPWADAAIALTAVQSAEDLNQAELTLNESNFAGHKATTILPALLKRDASQVTFESEDGKARLVIDMTRLNDKGNGELDGEVGGSSFSHTQLNCQMLAM